MTTIRFARLLGLAVAASLFAGCSSDDGRDEGAATFTLTVLVSGSGTVDSNPPGITNCTGSTGTCTATYAAGTSVQLTATPGPSSQFRAWTGTCTPNTAATCTVTMDANRTEVAVFESTAVGGIGDTFALSATSDLVTFNLTSPGTQVSNTAITGMAAGDEMAGIDFRPSNGVLYGVGIGGGSARIYVIDRVTAIATRVAVITEGGNPATITGTELGMDFNPVTDQLVLTTQDRVLQVTPGTGAAASVALNPANMGVRALAFTNGFKGAQKTTAFVVDADELLELDPGTGQLTAPRNVGATITPANGFDIFGPTGTAYLVYNAPTLPVLRTVNLTTGALGAAQNIGMSEGVRGFAIPTRPEPDVFAICNASVTTAGPTANPNPCVQGKTLHRFKVTTPNSYVHVGAMNFAGGATAKALDTRPADGVLVALTSDGKLYTVDSTTAAVGAGVTLVADPGDTTDPFTTFNGNLLYDMEFDPTTGLVRILSSADDNWLVDPANGQVTTEGKLQHSFQVSAVAYTNNASGATSSTLFALDSRGDRLFTLNSGNGTLTTLVGSLGVDAQMPNGFEIVSTFTPPNTFTNVGYAAWNVSNVPNLFTIDLATGAATARGAIGGGLPISAMSATINQGAATELYVTTDGANPHLLSFNPATPGTITSDRAITGLQASEVIVGLDFRPSNNTLFALGNTAGTGRLYTINIATGVATLVGSLMTQTVPPAAFPLSATFYGMDFDPASAGANNIKVVDDTGRNFTINATTATVASNGSLPNPTITSGAHTQSFNGATTTKVLAFNALGPISNTSGAPDSLMRLDPVSSGILEYLPDDTGTDADAATDTGCDIAGGHDGLALLALQIVGDVAEDSFATLFAFDPEQGNATPVETIGKESSPQAPGDTRISVVDIAVRFP